MTMMPKSDPLQALLVRAREANAIERNRVSLETFLADLRTEDKDLDEAQLKQIQLSIYEALLGLLDATTSVSQTTQASAATASRAAQTDAATVTLWDLLPKARDEAYDRGFKAGKDEGPVQDTDQDNGTDMKEGLAIGFEQGQAEGLKTGLEQGREVGMQCGIEQGRKSGYAEGLAEGMRQAKEEITKLSERRIRRHEDRKEVAREKVVVKLPPKLAATIPKKEEEEAAIKLKSKPKGYGVDPFASLVDLVLKK